MMIPIQDNILVNTDRISIVKQHKVNNAFRIEVVVDSHSYTVDDKFNDEFKAFLKLGLGKDGKVSQYVAL